MPAKKPRKVTKRPAIWFRFDRTTGTGMVRMVRRTAESSGLMGMLHFTDEEWVLFKHRVLRVHPDLFEVEER